MTTAVLVRHGRTAANLAGVLAGRAPGVLLDDVGRQQAAAAAAQLAAVPLRAVVTSPLERCRQTAEQIAAVAQHAVAIAEDAALLECGYGRWTGQSLRDLATEELWTTVQRQPSAARFPDGESLAEMSSRVIGAVRSWDARMHAEHGPDAVWVAVTHGDPIKAVLADALGLHLDGFQRIVVNPASISVIRYTPERPYVLAVNLGAVDLGTLLAPRRPEAGRSGAADAPVGGGLGSADTGTT